MVRKKVKYEWKKTVKKVIIEGVELFIAGALVVYLEQPWFLALKPVLVGFRNWLKHRKDGDNIF